MTIGSADMAGSLRKAGCCMCGERRRRASAPTRLGATLSLQTQRLPSLVRGRTFPRMGRTADYSNERCPVAAALQVVGDPWTLLILRDAFFGVRRFDEWQ